MRITLKPATNLVIMNPTRSIRNLSPGPKTHLRTQIPDKSLSRKCAYSEHVKFSQIVWLKFLSSGKYIRISAAHNVLCDREEIGGISRNRLIGNTARCGQYAIRCKALVFKMPASIMILGPVQRLFFINSSSQWREALALRRESSHALGQYENAARPCID